jgi:MATE family multidrug resistance protein
MSSDFIRAGGRRGHRLSPDKERGVTDRLGWHGEGGGREVLRLALPFILSNSLWTLQITIDRILLSQWSSDAVAAAMPAALLIWTPFTLFQNTAAYATTFVAQYVGAGRSHRVGSVLWQTLYFSLVAGLGFLGLILLGGPITRLAGHEESIRVMEEAFFRCLCFTALPTLITASVNGFFGGRGDSWTVLFINAVGLVVNAVLDYCWIFGRFGFPEWGIEGAGWATVTGSCASALVGLVLVFRPRYRETYNTIRSWRFDPELFRRLLRFGLPNGLQWMLDGLAFTVFLMIVGRLGGVELTASNIAISINFVAILPMLGMGQAVEVLVGQRLGQDRPDLAERSTWTSFKLAFTYVACVAILYACTPQLFLYFFENGDEKWPQVAHMVTVVLRFVAVYCLFDSMNLIFSFALRGAGDTRFVTAVALALAWPIMVLPTAAAYYYGWGLYWAWTFASAFIIALAFTFLGRFRHGKWKSMRVIEAAPPSFDRLKPEPCLEQAG